MGGVGNTGGMRIAAISDVHGNLPALDAVLEHIAAQRVDLTVNLGDILSGGVLPAATADRLLALRLPTVRGNHERQVLETALDSMGPSDRLAAEQLRPEVSAWLASLTPRLEVAAGVLAFHGSPTDDLVYLLETVEAGGARPATEAEVTARIGADTDWALLLCGHTHLQRAMRVAGGPFVVNPGSVGWPAYADDEPHPHVMEAGTPHARYAIVDDAGGDWDVTFHAVHYDWESAALVAEDNGRPDIARAVRTGRV